MEINPIMARNWRNLKRPRGIHIIEDQERYGKYVAEPLERGYGYTIGNALKKILLSSIRGSAVVAFRVQELNNEGEISAITESFEMLSLNLKELNLWTTAQEPLVIRCEVNKGEVFAKDLNLTEEIQVLNPDLYLCTVTEMSQVITLEIRTGYGYHLAQDHRQVSDELIAIDSMFSPVIRVNYQVSNARIGQRTDYDKLTLHVWTNGGLPPQDAIVFSARLFREQMTTFINFKEEEEFVVIEEEEEEVPIYNEHLDLPVSELDLPVRAANCLRSANIGYIGELVQRNEKDMVEIKNFGRKSLNDTTEVLTQRGLSLGMVISDWIRPDER